MRLVELVVLIVAAVAVGAVVYRALTAQAVRGGRWQVQERTERDGTVLVEVIRAGQHRRLVRALGPGLETDAFEWQLAEARSDAEAQAAALNAGRAPRA